jgi:BirA family biotin operon repressor/biotin-[acetyl-CoA-carboxylase] ligase
MSDTAAELPGGCALLHLGEVDSTNAEAMRRLLAGESGPLWVLADRQSAGRGRSGRPWASAPGNLFASLLVETDCPPSKAGQLSLVAGVAAVEAIAKMGPVRGVRLKWPNDILIGQAKAGGILVESSSRPQQPGVVAVVGVGLNLASAPEDLGPAATYLAAHGLSLSPREALCFLAQAMNVCLDMWNGGEGFARVREAWLARAGGVGEPLTVHTAGGLVHGRFAGLDEDGALIVTTADGRQLSFAFGDVSLADQTDETAAQGKDERR